MSEAPVGIEDLHCPISGVEAGMVFLQVLVQYFGVDGGGGGDLIWVEGAYLLMMRVLHLLIFLISSI